MHGGVAQGLGEAFREQMLFGDDGQALTGTLMNYAVLRAGDMPHAHLGRDRDAESFQSAWASKAWAKPEPTARRRRWPTP